MQGMSRTRKLVGLLALSGALMSGGCGDSQNASSTSAASGSQKSLRAAALSLQSAMDDSSRSIDTVRGTRDSLERLAASLQPAVAQTGDVIGLLAPVAADGGEGAMLLDGARQQRSFLQFSIDATNARTRTAANSALTRARTAGRQASDTYAKIVQQPETELAGLLPTSTAFNSGRLRDAVRNVAKKKSPSSGSGSNGGGGGSSKGDAGGGSGSGPKDCGDGLTANSATSCPFARNVADEYRSSGGASVINVYSPVTKQSYTLNCSSGSPVICSGGNDAQVTIR